MCIYRKIGSIEIHRKVCECMRTSNACSILFYCIGSLYIKSTRVRLCLCVCEIGNDCVNKSMMRIHAPHTHFMSISGANAMHAFKIPKNESGLSDCLWNCVWENEKESAHQINGLLCVCVNATHFNIISCVSVVT